MKANLLYIRIVQTEFPLQQKWCQISKQSSENYSNWRTEMVHWSCKRITRSPSALGTDLSVSTPALGRYNHRWNKRWKALTRRVNWSNLLLCKCIILCIMSYSAWIGHEVMMLLQRTDRWVAGWLPSLYLDDLNDCLSVKFAVCAGLISTRCLENPFFLIFIYLEWESKRSPKTRADKPKITSSAENDNYILKMPV